MCLLQIELCLINLKNQHTVTLRSTARSTLYFMYALISSVQYVKRNLVGSLYILELNKEFKTFLNTCVISLSFNKSELLPQLLITEDNSLRKMQLSFFSNIYAHFIGKSETFANVEEASAIERETLEICECGCKILACECGCSTERRFFVFAGADVVWI